MFFLGHWSGNRHHQTAPSHVVRNQPTGLDEFHQVSSSYKHTSGCSIQSSMCSMAFLTDAPSSYLSQAARFSSDVSRMMLISPRIFSPGRHVAQRAVMHVQDSSLSSSPSLIGAMLYRWLLDVELTFDV